MLEDKSTDLILVDGSFNDDESGYDHHPGLVLDFLKFCHNNWLCKHLLAE